MTDEAQAFANVRVVWDPPPPDPEATVFAARLLSRMLSTVAAYPRAYAYEVLLTEHAERIGAFVPHTPDRTTREQDLLLRGALHDFALAVLAGVKGDLDRKIGLDLATTLVPILADKKGKS